MYRVHPIARISRNMNDTIYREELLEHYSDPHNFGVLRKFQKTSRQYNPFCGDNITIYTTFSDEVLSDISFTGKGCVISIASASLLTDFVKGKKKARIKKVTEQELLSFINIPISESRKKCALLVLSVLQDCL